MFYLVHALVFTSSYSCTNCLPACIFRVSGVTYAGTQSTIFKSTNQQYSYHNNEVLLGCVKYSKNKPLGAIYLFCMTLYDSVRKWNIRMPPFSHLAHFPYIKLFPTKFILLGITFNYKPQIQSDTVSILL